MLSFESANDLVSFHCMGGKVNIDVTDGLFPTCQAEKGQL